MQRLMLIIHKYHLKIQKRASDKDLEHKNIFGGTNEEKERTRSTWGLNHGGEKIEATVWAPAASLWLAWPSEQGLNDLLQSLPIN